MEPTPRLHGKVTLAAALPTPDDCCTECGCNDTAIIVDVPGTPGIYVATSDPPSPIPLPYIGWANTATGALWFADPVTRFPVPFLA